MFRFYSRKVHPAAYYKNEIQKKNTKVDIHRALSVRFNLIGKDNIQPELIATFPVWDVRDGRCSESHF